MSASPFSINRRCAPGLHVAQDHALHRRRAVARVLGIQDHALVRFPAPQRERAGAGGAGLQPLVAEIAIALVLERDLLVDDRADPAARQFSTRVGARLSGIFSSTVMSSVARTIWSTFSGVQPNWLKMKLGVLFSLITRVSENTTSAAVTGLPEWKV